MDNKIILDNNILYTSLLKNKKKIKTIEIGLEFLDLFLKDLDDIKNLSLDQNENDLDLTDISIYSLKESKIIKLNLSSTLFQEKLQFFYRQFLETNFFINFSWYKQMKLILEKTLKDKYKYNSIDAINLVISYVSDCFRFFSTGFNNYDYDQIYNYLSKNFILAGLDEKESKEFAYVLMESLFSNDLLIYTSNSNLNFFFKKKFKLSDSNMDIVFNLNSRFLGLVSGDIQSKFKAEDLINFNAKFLLNDISKSIRNFNSNFKGRLSVSQLIPLISRDYPDLLNELLDYSVLDITPNLIKDVPDFILDSVKGLYFYKILINEYFLQSVIASYFSYYYLKPKLNNILYNDSYSDLFKEKK